jgi:hypothetical protein
MKHYLIKMQKDILEYELKTKTNEDYTKNNKVSGKLYSSLNIDINYKYNLRFNFSIYLTYLACIIKILSIYFNLLSI